MVRSRMTNKKIATYQTYNSQDCTSTGGDWALYADGRVSCTTRNRWAGSIDGERWLIEDALADGDESAENKLIAFTHDAERNHADLGDAGMRLVKAGVIVQ